MNGLSTPDSEEREDKNPRSKMSLEDERKRRAIANGAVALAMYMRSIPTVVNASLLMASPRPFKDSLLYGQR